MGQKFQEDGRSLVSVEARKGPKFAAFYATVLTAKMIMMALAGSDHPYEYLTRLR
jgi:hypothetical protein